MDKKTEALKLSLEAAYLAGFNDSAEGYNGEYPFRDHGATPTKDRYWVDRRDAHIREALAEQPAQKEPVRTRAEFERWAASYSTFSLERDDEPSHGITGYKSVEQTMLWHAWHAAKTKAPEGASGGESRRETQLDLADPDCTHKFQIAPSSGIRICINCGLSEMVAQKSAQATSPPAQRKPLTDEEIDELSRTMVKGNKSVNWLCRAIEAAHDIKGKA